MREMQQRLATDPELRAAQQAAHRDYLARRDAAAAAAGVQPLPPGTQSAGGMPDRVKCLHALVAHELAVPGANPLGREAADAAGEWWARGPCVPPGTVSPREAVPPGSRPSTAAPTRCGCWWPTSTRAAGRLTDVDRRMRDRPAGPGRGRHRAARRPKRWSARCGALAATRQIIAAPSAAAGADGGHQRHPGRGERRRVRRGRRRACSAIEPEVLSGEDEAYLSFTGATAELAARTRPPLTWSSTSAAARPSSCSASAGAGGRPP